VCNPDDETPCVDGEPSDEAVHGDMRSQGQRNHDALKTMGPQRLSLGGVGSAQWAAGHDHRVHLVAGPAVGGRCRRHRRGHAAADARGDQAGVPGPSLLGDLRQAHPRAALLRPGQTLRHRRAAHCVACASTAAAPVRAARLRVTGVRRTMSTAGLPPMAKPTSTSSPWPAARITASSKRGGWDYSKTQRWPHRMDSTTTPRHGTVTRQRLPPPRKVPAARRG